MRVAVITVGDELLLGDVADTNVAWLDRRLASVGLPVCWSASARDDVGEIVETLRDGLRRADVVLVSGGLGPTSDDLTRDALAELCGVALRRDPATESLVGAAYASRGLSPGDLALRQADIPEGANILPNPVGSAPGLVVRAGSATVIALPGVPSELYALTEQSVLPLLVELAGGATGHRLAMLRVALLGESQVASRLAPMTAELEAEQVRLAYLASPGEVLVRFSCDRADAEIVVRRVAERAAELLGDVVSGSDDDVLPATVLRLLTQRGHTVATAESLTGGALSATLTDVAGASAAFLGGSVTYSTDAKHDQLGVPRSLLDEHGPVHSEVAAAMAFGARERWGSDWAMACTGVAGPGPADGHPAGTVHVAVAGPGSCVVRSVQLPGDRAVVRELTVIWALDLLRRALLAAPDG